MKSIYLIAQHSLLLLFLILGYVTRGDSQSVDSLTGGSKHSYSAPVTRDGDTVFTLPHQFIIESSILVNLDTIGLSSSVDYEINLRFGTITLFSSTLRKIINDSSTHTLHVSYQALPFTFKPSYRHRERVISMDTAKGEIITVSQTTPSFQIDDLFGSNLQKSGSILRGVTVGSNRDLSLTSGFRMQMSGNLTDDIDIVATLTDENSPIQPEGTTQTLQEIDRVFIQLRGNNFTSTLGDINLNLTGNEFGNINRKLTGAQGYAKYRTGDLSGDVHLAGAVTRGKFTSNEFLGSDGVQGPYRLTGENNNRSIIIIAGTERVFWNGEKISRGENADYVIDYATAEITFTTRRPVNHGSRITVDFEYTDRQFNRSLYGIKTGVGLFDDRWRLNGMFVQENDNENSPIDLQLMDADKQVLQSAGGDRNKAVRSGVEWVGPGKGQYRVIDTLINISPGKDSLVTIYRYAPEDTINAVYAVTFSDVGIVMGSYQKVAIGQYQFTGLKNGSYEPIRFLPMPQGHSLVGIDFSGEPSENLKLSGEYAVSSFNLNRFSEIAGTQKNGAAFKLGFQYSPRDIRIGGMNLGSITVDIKKRFIGKDFLALDRTNEVEFNRKWNLIDTLKHNEQMAEGTVSYKPFQSLTLLSGFGQLERGDRFSSRRLNAGVQINDDKIPQIEYALEGITTENRYSMLDNSWIRQRTDARYQIGIFMPHFRGAHEVLTSHAGGNDTLRKGSYRWGEVAPGFSINNNRNFFFDMELGFQRDDSLSSNHLEPVSNSLLQTYNSRWSPTDHFSTTIDMTLHRRNFSEEFKRRGNRDQDNLLLKWQTKLNPVRDGIESDWYYEVATGRSAKLERIFQKVPKGTGNYVYAGDLNDNRVIDQMDFQLSRFDGDYIVLTLPSDQLVPIVDVKASIRLRMNGETIFSREDWFGETMATLSSETYLRVDEKSSEPDKKSIYLLNLSHFLREQSTIIGSNLIMQDVYFLEKNPDFSLRYRYTQRWGFTQFALLNEKTYARENAIRVKWQFMEDISNQTEYSRKNDVLTASEFSFRVRRILSDKFSSDWSYRPVQDVELGFKFAFGNGTNYDTATAELNEQSVRFVYSFAELSQFRVEFSREEVLLKHFVSTLPFELTDGRVRGQSWFWQMTLDHRISKFFMVSMNYQGRREGDGAQVHLGKAELRAFF